MALLWRLYFQRGCCISPLGRGLRSSPESRRQPGCTVKAFIFAPVNAFGSYWIFIKVMDVLGFISALSLVWLIGLCIGWWLSALKAKDKKVDEYYLRPNAGSILFGAMTAGAGGFCVAFAEKTLQANHVTFPGSSVFDSGQLIPLLVGIFTFVQALVSAVKSLMDWDFESPPILEELQNNDDRDRNGNHSEPSNWGRGRV